MRLRIDELAAQTGVTSRNIRAYREKGLLPAPQLEGRTGYYTEEHVQRLEIIEDLQERGFSLEAIRQTLEVWSIGGDFSHLLGLRSLLNSPFHDEEPAFESVAQMIQRFPEVQSDPGLLTRAVTLGLIEAHDGDQLKIPSPLLVEAGAELVAVGVPLAEILDLFEQVQIDMADVAEQFVGIVERNLVTPAHLSTPPDDHATHVIDTLQRLRPLATEVIKPILARELTRAVDRAARRVAAQITVDG
ncbi:MAG: MerR family transcriptional regulator [Euzebya sp.]